MSIYDFEAETLDGKPAPLSSYRDQVVLIVNTASKCGFTPQYAGLETLFRKYRDRGFVVLGFPCNQFGAQEPGDAAEIARGDQAVALEGEDGIHGKHSCISPGITRVNYISQ